MRGRFLAIASAMFLVAGCTVGPDYVRPELEAPSAYETVYSPPDSADHTWWRGFGDPQLDKLVDQALAQNLDIAQSLARLDEALANARVTRSGLFPSINGSLSAETSAPLDGGNASDNASAQLSLGFIPDIFGRQKRAVEQARATARAQAHQVSGARQLVAASVVDRFIGLKRAAARLQLLDESLGLQRQTLEIVQLRFEAGLAADLDVRRAEADLARTTAQRGSLVLLQAQAEYSLAILAGEPPRQGLAQSFAGEITVPVFAAGPPIMTPAELVRRRPDLRAAEATLAAATAAIGVATADLYPSFSVPGFVTADLGASGALAENAVAGLGLQIGLPLLDGGARAARVDAAEARAQAAFLAYRQTLHLSLNDVETALVAIQSFEDRLVEFERAVAASEDAYEQLDALYREGLTSFIDILDAQRTLIASREAYVDSQADLAAAIASLYLAVGAPTQAGDP